MLLLFMTYDTIETTRQVQQHSENLYMENSREMNVETSNRPFVLVIYNDFYKRKGSEPQPLFYSLVLFHQTSNYGSVIGKNENTKS